jgi:ssDNA-binding Zn-finger/Zn-ribbon topoisomerase 1
MGLKCSVIGHKYGEASVEREREEQGSEVVITVQERETCDRCGKTRIVSENKEVTSIETPSDIAGEMVDTDEEEEEAVSEPEASAADDEIEEAESDTEETEVAESGPEETEATAVEAVDPDTDDAEILDDDTDHEGGDSELDDPSTVESVTDTGDPADAPEVEETESEEDDAVIIDAETDEETSDREPGQWPEEPADNGDDWKPETVMGEQTDEKEEDEDDDSSGLEPLGTSAVTVPDGQFRCPECDFSTDVASSSLRAGDFCPECHKGALVTSEE